MKYCDQHDVNDNKNNNSNNNCNCKTKINCPMNDLCNSKKRSKSSYYFPKGKYKR